MTNDFEGRLARIAWVVLAGACRPAETAAPPAPTTVDVATPASSAVSPASSVVATPDAIASSAPDAAVAAPPALPDPRAVCADYKSKTANDPSGPRAQTPTQTQRVYYLAEDLQARRLDDAKVECRIVWDRAKSMETIMVAPTCCPQARTSAPCPPPSPQQFPGERAKVEVAVVKNDGSRVSSTLAWNQWVQEPPRHMCGRRPEGFVAGASGETIGARLAEMAELEAASIAAFDRLARELRAHGAPDALVARARAAGRDEVRHARELRALARRFGASLLTTRAKKLAVRAPVAIAIENAVEGCVFETLGAVVATFQAERAADAAVRAAFARIAADERRHAALAWDVDAWLASICTSDERDAVERARSDARERLRGAAPSDDEASRALGLPAPRERDALVRGVCELAA